MALNLSQSTQFKVKELTLHTKLGSVNIANIYQEINIFDSVFMAAMKGDILINDAIGLADKLLLDGSEYISMKITKDDEVTGTVFEKTFRIVSLANRKNVNQNSETYVIHFVSEEMVLSMQQKINQSFTGIYSDMVKKVMNNVLRVPAKRIANIEQTKGVHSVVIPTLSPFDAMEWVTKKAINSEGLPNMLFFENKAGYNFISLSTLISRTPITTINFEPKNISESRDDEFLGARDVRVVNQFNHLDNIENGVYAGKFFGIDPLTRKVRINQIDYLQTYKKTNKHLNKYPNFAGGKNRTGKDSAQMFDSKISLYVFSSLRAGTPYIATNDSKTGTIIDDTHSYVFQRAPIFANLLQTTLHINMPGNFGLSSGYVVNVKMPSRSAKTDNQDVLDDSLTGKYLITATHHMITPEKHVTILEAATDSTNRVFTTYQTGEMAGASKV